MLDRVNEVKDIQILRNVRLGYVVDPVFSSAVYRVGFTAQHFDE